MVCCTPFLRQQIALIQPKLIVALGAIAAQYLLSTKTAIGSLRGKRFEYADTGIPLIATYHPAYLLRSPLQKRKAWEDLQLIHKMMTEQD
jgi:DNA polymerase